MENTQHGHLHFRSPVFKLQCCLGLTPLNSNISGEMTQLMMHNQEKYVPTVELESGSEAHVEQIFFDGDALTEERARNVQWTFKDGDNKLDRLEGLNPVHTDWHAKLKLYDVSYYEQKHCIIIFMNLRAS